MFATQTFSQRTQTGNAKRQRDAQQNARERQLATRKGNATHNRFFEAEFIATSRVFETYFCTDRCMFAEVDFLQRDRSILGTQLCTEELQHTLHKDFSHRDRIVLGTQLCTDFAQRYFCTDELQHFLHREVREICKAKNNLQQTQQICNANELLH